ncbi:MAG: class I SAM-dependent methyltransferase [Bacteroidia bacterium]
MDPYKITFETWNKIANIYQEKFMDLDLYNDTYDLFCSHLKTSSKILEIGCGPGNITRYLLHKRPDLKIEGVDVAPNMIALAKENNPAADFKVMDCRNLNTVTEKFDAILCGFCMPYLSKDACTKLIKDSSALLNTNGLFYFSTIEGDYSRSGYESGSSGDQAFVYYYRENDLSELLKENNFETVELIQKHYQKTETELSTHLIFIARKK